MRIRDGDDVVDQVLENYQDMVDDTLDEFEEDATSQTLIKPNGERMW